MNGSLFQHEIMKMCKLSFTVLLLMAYQDANYKKQDTKTTMPVQRVKKKRYKTKIHAAAAAIMYLSSGNSRFYGTLM